MWELLWRAFDHVFCLRKKHPSFNNVCVILLCWWQQREMQSELFYYLSLKRSSFQIKNVTLVQTERSLHWTEDDPRRDCWQHLRLWTMCPGVNWCYSYNCRWLESGELYVSNKIIITLHCYQLLLQCLKISSNTPTDWHQHSSGTTKLWCQIIRLCKKESRLLQSWNIWSFVLRLTPQQLQLCG